MSEEAVVEKPVETAASAPVAAASAAAQAASSAVSAASAASAAGEACPTDTATLTKRVMDEAGLNEYERSIATGGAAHQVAEVASSLFGFRILSDAAQAGAGAVTIPKKIAAAIDADDCALGQLGNLHPNHQAYYATYGKGKGGNKEASADKPQENSGFNPLKSLFGR